MGSPIIYSQANSNADLYNHALSSAYTLWGRLNNPDYALARDPDIWIKAQRDATIAQAVATRLHMIAGRDWTCEAGGGGASDDNDKMVASVIDELIRNIRGFTESRLQLATSCFRGRSYAFIEGREEVRNFGDGKARRWWVPSRLRDVDERRIAYYSERYQDKEGRVRLRVRQEMYSVTAGRMMELTREDLRNFVRIVYKSEESNLGYGSGLLSSVFFMWWMKSVIFKEGLQGLERWSQGVLIGKIDPNREGSTGKTNEAIRDELFESLRDMRSRNVVVMGEGESIEVIDGGSAGSQMVMDFVRYCDEKLLSLILGSVLPFGGAESSGSYARAEIEQSTSNSLIRFDIDKLDESLSNDLIGLLIDSNMQPLRELGLAEAAVPVFRTTVSDRADTQEAASSVATLSGLGLPLKTAEVYRRTGWSEPGGDDPTFVATPPEAPVGLPFGAGEDWSRRGGD